MTNKDIIHWEDPRLLANAEPWRSLGRTKTQRKPLPKLFLKMMIASGVFMEGWK